MSDFRKIQSFSIASPLRKEVSHSAQAEAVRINVELHTNLYKKGNVKVATSKDYDDLRAAIRANANKA